MQNKLTTPHSLADSYSCINLCHSRESSFLMGAVTVNPSMTTTTGMPCKALFAAGDSQKEDRAGNSGLTFCLLKAHRSFPAEATASKLIRNKTAYEMGLMVLRWVKKWELGLMEMWQVQVGKVLERCVPSLSALWQWCGAGIDPLLLLLHSNRKLLPKLATPCSVTAAAINLSALTLSWSPRNTYTLALR